MKWSSSFRPSTVSRPIGFVLICMRSSSATSSAHLFNVVSSLDSMVLGETQILGQVRDAYDSAREASAVGAILNPLFQRRHLRRQAGDDANVAERRPYQRRERRG